MVFNSINCCASHDQNVIKLCAKQGAGSVENIKVNMVLILPFIILWFIKKYEMWGAWVAQLVKCPTLGFGSGHDLMVHAFEPYIRLQANSAEPSWDSLSPSLSAPLLFTLCLCLCLSK